MNWNAISAVSEIIGATAVVISIVYLAIQVRQNTKQVEEGVREKRIATLGLLREAWTDIRSTIYRDPALASLWNRANRRHHELTDDERTQVNFLFLDFFWAFATDWMVAEEGGLRESVESAITNNILVYDSPGIRAWWSSTHHRQEYPIDFVRFVDRTFDK